MVSGPARPCAASIAAVAAVFASSEKARQRRADSGLRETTISMSAGIAASMARSNVRPSAANTSPGVSNPAMCLSLAKSDEINE